jgi:hypothetical protein
MTAARRNVEVLHMDDAQVLVRGTLEEGDQVITSGPHRIVAGQYVTASR